MVVISLVSSSLQTVVDTEVLTVPMRSTERGSFGCQVTGGSDSHIPPTIDMIVPGEQGAGSLGCALCCRNNPNNIMYVCRVCIAHTLTFIMYYIVYVRMLCVLCAACAYH